MKSINLYCPINTTGYGLASINILKSLNALGVSTTLTNIGSIDFEDEKDAEVIKLNLEAQASLNIEDPCIKIWHQFDLASRIGKGRYYAYPFFEIDTFTKQEKNHMMMTDDIIVSSQWAKDVILNNQIEKNIHVVPLGVDLSVFNGLDNSSMYDKYVFITIGKWEIRKSHDLVIKLFNQAFNTNDNVELWMVTHNPFLSKEQTQEWHNLVDNSVLREKIKIFPRVPNQKALAELISYASCGIYISRAEGWNLDLLETMAMNKPVIVTNYSAHTEFCNTNNSYLIDIENKEPAIDNKWFNGTGNWAKIGENQQEQIIEHMRFVYNNKIRSNAHGLSTAQSLTWANTGNILLGCIDS